MEEWKKYRLVLLLIAIIGVGFFLRFYHLADWIHFELDQARDARVIDRALEGDAFDLPLLGPKAGGTFLRLGPGFYWLEYLGALLFGGAIVGGVTMVALASILSIPLFYLIARRFFSDALAYPLTLLFATSAFLTLYGRFAWNPNFIPFFTLLGFYALLRAVDTNERRQGWWLVLTFFAIGMATHMHFLAFLGLPVIVLLFLLFLRPRISLKFWSLAVSIFFLLYVPMMLNEIETGGQNSQSFFEALTEKSTKEDHPLLEKTIRNISEFGLHSTVILTGFEGATFPAIIAKNGVFGSVCDTKCDQGKWYGLSAIILLSLSLVALIWCFINEVDSRKKNVLLLSLLWFGISFGLFLPLSYGIAPRFFLLNAPLFFLLLGILLHTAQRLFFNQKAIGTLTAGAIVILLVLLNLTFLTHRFGELAEAGNSMVKSAPDRILKERVRVTLKQEQIIVDFLEQKGLEKNAPVYMFSEPQYRRALKYLMEQRGIENDVLGFSGIYRQGVYFLIVRTQSDLEDAVKKYLTSYTVGETTYFGTLVAIELIPKDDAIMAERQDFSLPENNAPSKAPPRYTFREFLERSGEPIVEEGDDEEGG